MFYVANWIVLASLLGCSIMIFVFVHWFEDQLSENKPLTRMFWAALYCCNFGLPVLLGGMLIEYREGQSLAETVWGLATWLCLILTMLMHLVSYLPPLEESD
jgi:hypothetical protein